MLETFFFNKNKNGEIPIFKTFLAKKLHFGLYFTVNRQFGQNRRIWRHYDVTHGMFVFFRYVWKEETHDSYTMVPNKHTSGVYFSEGK